jgi:hypothetical protein
MMGATAAAAGATGMRAWLAAKGFRWMTPGRMRLATIALIVVGLIAASVGLGGP